MTKKTLNKKELEAIPDEELAKLVNAFNHDLDDSGKKDTIIYFDDEDIEWPEDLDPKAKFKQKG